jgi:colicin import membrane protein
MKNEIVKINASDYGLEESKASEIKAMFLPMLTKMEELETQYNDILKQEINPETCQMAKDLRLSYVKVRTGTADIHKNLKTFYLNGGRFVDAFKNTQAFASGEKEKTLKNIEDFFENQERERTEKLRVERLALIKPYTEIEPLALGHMEQTVFDNLLQGFKVAYETQIAAEKKAEEDRIAAAKAEAERIEAQRLENIRLKEEAEERERLAEIERKKNEKIIAAQKAKAEAERKERERLEAEIEARKQADEKAKREADAKIEAERKAKLAEEKKAKLAPDKTKLLNFMQAINNLPRPEVKSIEAADIASKANTYLVQCANYIKDNANKL